MPLKAAVVGAGISGLSLMGRSWIRIPWPSYRRSRLRFSF